MHRPSDLIDEPSRLKQFAWEEWEGEVIAVIFRASDNGLDRYVVKRYIEQVLSQCERWKQLSFYFPSISPLIRVHTLTSYEIELMQTILNYHLKNRLHLHLTQTNDQLIDYEELLDFISHAQELYIKHSNPYNNNYWINGKKSSIPLIPTVHSTYTLPKPIISPLSQSIKTSPVKSSLPITNTSNHVSQSLSTIQPKSNLSISPEHYPRTLSNAKIDGSGWVQINNVYLPFIIKNQQRLVPYQILVACKILEIDELHSILIRATTTDLTLINSMIHDCKINTQPISENAYLINIYHLLIGTKNLIYIKILPNDNPTSKINRQYKTVLTLQGGSLYITTHRISFICSHNHTYIPLNDILNIYPNLETQLKTLARIPRTNELDYLQLVQIYYKDKELPNDTLLINLEDLNQRQIISTKTLSLIEYHAQEKLQFEQDISLLNKNSSRNKRKNLQSHENKSSQQKFKSTNPWLQSNSGHRGKTRWQ